MADIPSPLPYDLEFDEPSGILYGVVKAPQVGSNFQTVNGFALQRELEKRGYHQLLIPPLNINTFLKQIKSAKVGRYPLGERKDGLVNIIIAPDRLSASAKISRAWGGRPLKQADIVEAINDNKIEKQCILIDALKVLADHYREDIEILFAKSIPPTPGTDASLKNLIRSTERKQHNIDSDTTIDQHDIYNFTNVQPGQALLLKTPATPGTDGCDVLGKPITATPGNDIIFSTPLEGVAFSETDENCLVATISGHPVFSKNGVKVDPVLSLERVDLHSGNIEFEGSVQVKHDVASGFNIKAGGNVHVKGQVERAEIDAGGDIIVGCGILGGEEKQEGKTSKCMLAKLRCKGEVHAKFANLAKIESDGNVSIDEYAMQCHIDTKGELLLGQCRGRGNIIGGTNKSTVCVKAKILGSEAYIETHVEVDAKIKVEPKLANLYANFNRRLREREQLQTILKNIQGKPGEQVGNLQLNKTKKIQSTLIALEQQILKIEHQIESLEAETHSGGIATVNVSGMVYPNVTILIGERAWRSTKEFRRKTFRLVNQKIKILPMIEHQ